MDDIEDQIFGEFKPESMHEIFRIKKQLLYLRRSITPLRDVFNTLLRREQPLFARETHVYFQDVYDHIIRVAATIDTLVPVRRQQSDEHGDETSDFDCDDSDVRDLDRRNLRDEF